MKSLRVILALTCTVCAAIAWRAPGILYASEFGGGWLSGRLLDAQFVAACLFALTALVSLAYPRVGAVIALLASLLGLPLYLYFTAPGPFRRLVPGEYSVPLQGSFVWDSWSIAGILSIAVAICISLLVLHPSRPQRSE